MNLKTNVKEVTGVGEKRAQKFTKLNITNVNELIHHLPRAYQHRGNVLSLADAEDGTVGAFILTVGSEPKTTMIKNRMSLTKFMAFDDTRRCQITYFNQDYIKNSFIFGNAYRFWGKITVRGGMCMMSAPQYEPYIEGIPLPEFIPLYPLTEGITQKIMANTIQHAVKRVIAEDELPEILTENIRSKYNLCDVRYAIEAIHAPLNYDMLNRARERLAFDELFTFALGITLTKTKIKKVKALPMKRVDLKKFYSLLPFKPTNAQLRTNDEILGDMCGEAPMSRLVSGDVGSGKTVCAAAAVYIACKNGYQSAFMVPTEILAQQHYHDLKPMFESVGIRCALLIGSLKPTEKRRIHDYLQTGVIDLVIGTHALISAGVAFMKLGLVITDEQHRFGVMQRSALAERGENPHVLVMSATPIPRTLALILYGDLSISVIDEMPPGRQKVDTFIVDEDYRTRLNAFIRKQVEEGRQVYIVCP
ncbi:MAG: ATP-dependent DNA helicase RecG, partial [Oscillospiraceae bacterium]|nr:ATP-dependent DNA helicase RecG [Oscillospiraceae bacterium]